MFVKAGRMMFGQRVTPRVLLHWSPQCHRDDWGSISSPMPAGALASRTLFVSVRAMCGSISARAMVR